MTYDKQGDTRQFMDMEMVITSSTFTNRNRAVSEQFIWSAFPEAGQMGIPGPLAISLFLFSLFIQLYIMCISNVIIMNFVIAVFMLIIVAVRVASRIVDGFFSSQCLNKTNLFSCEKW